MKSTSKQKLKMLILRVFLRNNLYFHFCFSKKKKNYLGTEKTDPIVKKFRKFLGQIETKNGADYDQVLYFDPEFVDEDKLKQLVVCLEKLIHFF